MNTTCEPNSVKTLDEIRHRAAVVISSLAPYADAAFHREMFVVWASRWVSDDEAREIYDEIDEATLATRRMRFDLSRPAADRAHLWKISSLRGEVTNSWATWLIESPWWLATFVSVKTPDLFDPRAIANHVVEVTGFYLPRSAFRKFWPKLMASIELGGAANE